MQGPGYAPQHPPPNSGGTHTTLRVLFVVLALLTCGMLAWAPMLRLAIVTRKVSDWCLFALVAALDVAALVFIGTDNGGGEFQASGVLGVLLLLTTMVVTIAYYLFADIRHFSRYNRAQPTGFVPPQTQPTYGYPPQQQPAFGPGSVHHQPTQTDQPPGHRTPPPPPRPEPARIHQVQAELDELSDYLRKQEGGS